MADTTLFPMERLIDEAGDAAKRSRVLTFAIVTAAVIAAIATWNLREESWIKQRIRVVRDVERWNAWERAAATTQPATSVVDTVTAPPEDERRKTQAVEFAIINQIYDRNRAAAFRSKLEDLRYDNIVAMRLPLFGSYFDVNDLDMVSGVAFVILMIMLRYSLMREKSNLSVVFAEGEARGALRATYQLLQMRQVLTTPPRDPPGPHPAFWSHLPKVLICLPLGVQAAIFARDMMTIKTGMFYSAPTTLIVVLIAIACFVLMVLLTVSCVNHAVGLDAEWRNAHSKIASTHD